jgi:hypothetical protein
MLTLKASVAAAVLVVAMAATAGITYAVTRTTITMSCPAPTAGPPTADNRGIPLGNPLPLDQGKKW